MKTSVQLLSLLVAVLGIVSICGVSSALPRMYAPEPEMHGEEPGMYPPDPEMLEPVLAMFGAGPGPAEYGFGRPRRGVLMPDSGRFEMVHKKIETIRMWKLTEALDLNEEKSAKLFPLLRKYDDKRKDLGQQRRKLMRAMRELVRETSPSNAKLKETLDGLEANESSMEQLKNDEIRELKTVLTPYEQAKFIIFNENFEREMRLTIDRAREKGRAPGPARGQFRRR